MARQSSMWWDRFERIDSELLILKWMVGFAIALDVAILTRLFLH